MMALRIQFAIYSCIASCAGASICWIGQAKWMALSRDDVMNGIHVTDADLSVFVIFAFFYNCIACRILGTYVSVYVVRIGIILNKYCILWWGKGFACMGTCSIAQWLIGWRVRRL